MMNDESLSASVFEGFDTGDQNGPQLVGLFHQLGKSFGFDDTGLG